MKIANDLVIYKVVIKQNLRAFLDISGVITELENNIKSLFIENGDLCH